MWNLIPTGHRRKTLLGPGEKSKTRLELARGKRDGRGGGVLPVCCPPSAPLSAMEKESPAFAGLSG